MNFTPNPTQFFFHPKVQKDAVHYNKQTDQPENTSVFYSCQDDLPKGSFELPLS